MKAEHGKGHMVIFHGGEVLTDDCRAEVGQNGKKPVSLPVKLLKDGKSD